MKHTTVSAVNVNGLRDVTSQPKAATICHLFAHSHSDITFLLDTRLDATLEFRLTSHWDGPIFFAHNVDAHSAGIAVLLQPSNFTVNRVLRDPLGRYLILDVTTPTVTLLIVAIYAPASNVSARKAFFNDLKTKLAAVLQVDQQLVLLGDLNMVEDVVLDRAPSLHRPDASLPQFTSLKHTFDLEDTWRRKHPSTVDFTFHSSTGSRSRIDRVYTSRPIRHLVSQAAIIPFVHSDHQLIELQFISDLVQLGKSRWRMDVSILDAPQFRELFTAFWTHWRTKRGSYPTILQWWDKGKVHIERISRKFSSDVFHSRHKRIRSLRKRLRNSLTKDHLTATASLLSTTLAHELKVLEDIATQRALHSSQVQWLEQGEQCTKFFLNLQTKKREDTTIHSLLTPNGALLTSTPAILSETQRFYTALYSPASTSNNLQNIFLSRLDCALTSDQSLSCEGAISLPELTASLSQLNNNKSPGLDGIPAEFYQSFWPLLQHDFHAVSSAVFAQGSLTPSQRHAVIVLLPKSGDLRLLENWRPISLLNVDYKLMAKAIATRLHSVLPSVIREDQSCSVSNRRISHNLSLIRDFIAYSTLENLPASILTLDQMKAFDQVDHPFLRKILQRFNFGPQFLQWIQIFYSHALSRTQVNRTLSSPFSVLRGVRQGCPLAPLLYVLYVEVLAAAIRKEAKISGLTLQRTHIKCSLYADDITLFLTTDASFVALQDLLSQYELASGAKVNPDKCKGLWLGRNLHRPDSPLSYQWSSLSIKILGLHFSPHDDFLPDWHTKTDAFTRTLTLWRQRSLSLKGKSVVVTQLAMSKLSYLGHISVCPSSCLKRLHAAVSDFVWAGKRTRIAPHVLALPVHLGGLNVPDVSRKLQALRLSWLPQLFSPSMSGKWRLFMTYFLDQYKQLHLAENVFKTFITPTRLSSWHLPPFYSQLLRDWVALTANRRPLPTTLDLILHEPLFSNPHVVTTSVSRPTTYLFRPNWYSRVAFKSLHLVRDICYGVVPGFHTPTQLAELTGYPVHRSFVLRLRSSLPPQWRREISSRCGRLGRNDLTLFVRDASGVSTPAVISQVTTRSLYHSLNSFSFPLLQQRFSLDRIFFYPDWDAAVPGISWKALFLRMYRDHTDKSITDLQYKLIHNAGIATKLLMFTKRVLCFSNPMCPRCCCLPETIQHIFLDCSLVLPLRCVLSTLFSRLSPSPSLGWDQDRYFLAGYLNSPLPSVFAPLAELIRKSYFYATWFQRNQRLWHATLLPIIPLFYTKLTSYLTFQMTNTPPTRLPQFYQAYALDVIFSLHAGIITLLH